jgi:hypothetical protein
MLYDDDRGGPPFEPIGPNDDSQWVVPPVDAAYLDQFDDFGRILVVLAIADRHQPGSYPGDLVFETADLSWDQQTVDEVVVPLIDGGLITASQEDDGLYLAITEYGHQRVSDLTTLGE